MMPNASLKSAIGELREVLVQRHSDPVLEETVVSKPQVLARFQPVFSPENIPTLTEEEFKDFLLSKNNRHWSGLHRQGPYMCANMEALRRALAVLVDENAPIKQRLDQLLPPGKSPMVPRLGRAVLTAILQVMYPDKYGVWNMTSESAMKSLNIWPTFDRKESFGQRYLKMNETLLSLASQLQTDLWTLDSLWWRVRRGDSGDGGPPPPEDMDEGKTAFGLERHLQDFLQDNWEKTPLGKDWSLYEEEGEVVGVEYLTGQIGQIDLLARNDEKRKWLVVELKRNQSSDQTVGQVLRYMGWVEENLANGESVEGLIISRVADERLRLALKNTKNVSVLLYEVEFHLRKMGD